MPQPDDVAEHPKPSLHDLKEVSEVSDRLIHGLMTVSTGALGLSITFRGSITGVSPTALWLLGASWIFFVLVIIGYLVDRMAFFGLLSSKAFGEPLWESAGFFSSMGRFVAMFGFLLGIISLVLFGLLNLH